MGCWKIFDIFYLIHDSDIKILKGLDKHREKIRHITLLDTLYRDTKDEFEDICDKYIPAAIKYNEISKQYFKNAEDLLKKFNKPEKVKKRKEK